MPSAMPCCRRRAAADALHRRPRFLVARTGGDEFAVLSPFEIEECVDMFDVLSGDLYGGVDGVPPVTMSRWCNAALRAGTSTTTYTTN